MAGWTGGEREQEKESARKGGDPGYYTRSKKERFGNKRGLPKLPPPHFPEEVASPPISEHWGSQITHQGPPLSPPQGWGSRCSSPLLYIIISLSSGSHSCLKKFFFFGLNPSRSHFSIQLPPYLFPIITELLPKGSENKDPNKDLYTNVQGSIIHNSSKLGSTPMSTYR